jgi:putative SOS response-associated peptidase YedK
MINLYTIATRAQALSQMLNLPIETSYKPMYQARPGMPLPMIIYSGGKPKISYGFWGCIPERFTSPIPIFPMEKVLTQSPLNRWIHTQRCIIPANCFYCRNDETRDISLIRLLNARTFFMGGMYCELPVSGGKTNTHFILLTTDSADVIRPITTDMPVLLTKDVYHKWLDTEHLVDLMDLADQSGEHWFDYFTVSKNIITPGVNNRNLLKPLGLSHEEIQLRDQKLKTVDVKQDRFDRKGSKR